MMIIVKVSDKSVYLLFGGKIVSMAGQPMVEGDIPRLDATDAMMTRLITAYGAVVT
jgi:hypothetical protein